MNEPHFIFPFILDFNVLIILDQYTQIFAYVYKIYKMYINVQSYKKHITVHTHVHRHVSYNTIIYVCVSACVLLLRLNFELIDELHTVNTAS